jgi:hypothetical protein
VRATPDTLRIVTDSDLYDSEIGTKVTYWAPRIEKTLVEKGMTWSSDWELYVKVQEHYCFYYFVDHATRTQFWLEEVDLTDYGFTTAVSPSHLDHALQSLYWAHVEFFPMHFGGLSRQCIEELISTLSHGYVGACELYLSVKWRA